MKDSGVKWIGEIPEDWEVIRLKNVGTLYGGLTGKSGDDFKVEDNDTFSYFIPFTNIFNNNTINLNVLAKVKIKENEVQNNVEKGDVLFLMSSEDYDGIGKCALLNSAEIQPLYLNSFCKGMHINHKICNSGYINYYMQSDAGRTYCQLSANGFIRINLRQDKLTVCPLLLPPITEQTRISNYLDAKCTEIDELVKLEERMITELQKYKQSVITETVTRGLNKTAKLKDSGVEWIGMIPEEWGVYELKRIANLHKGLNITKDNLVENGIPVISYGQVHNKQNPGTRIVDDLIRYVDKSYLETDPDCIVKKGDFIFADTSEDFEGCGNCVYNDRNMLLFAGYHSIIVSPTIEMEGKYLAYLFRTGDWRIQIRSRVNGVKLFSISQKMLASSSIVLPPLTEQERISSYLDNKTEEIDGLIKLKESKIQGLKDYKKSLIYEYVTGKKKV